MENIQSFTKNCVTTECGHSFHTSCLMKNVAHNGFDCPYCRSEMAEEINNDDSDEDDDTGSYETDTFNDERLDAELIETHNDDILRGFRLFFNNVHGETYYETDEEEEHEYEEDMMYIRQKSIQINLPSMKYLEEKLKKRNIQYTDVLLYCCSTWTMLYEDQPIIDSIKYLQENVLQIMEEYQYECDLEEKYKKQMRLKMQSKTKKILMNMNMDMDEFKVELVNSAIRKKMYSRQVRICQSIYRLYNNEVPKMPNYNNDH